MFLLSRLYLLSQIKPRFDELSQKEKRKVVEDQHNAPVAPVNETLTAVFAAETPMGYWLSSLWGKPILGILRKP